jgi:hypothetical protein
MTKLLKLTLLVALAAALSLRESVAQTVDEVLALNIQLYTVSQGNMTTNRDRISSNVQVDKLTSRDVIQALGASTGYGFSAQARLVLLTPTNNLDNWTVQVRDGNRKIDVTGFFSHIAGSPSVGSAWVSTRTGAAGGTDYSVDSFALQDRPGYPPLSVHFQVSGFTVTRSDGVVNRRGQITGQEDRIVATVSGLGDENGAVNVIEGTISAEGVGTETVAPPTPPGTV